MADFCLDASWQGLPERVKGETVRALVNWMACAVGGARTALADAAVRGVVAMEPEGATPVVGRSERVGLASSAMLACINSSAHTFDDTHLATITHPTGPVAAAAFAAAHALATSGQPVAGSELLASLIIGMELECRLSNAIAATGGSNLGWYMTGLSGGVGAAAAVGRLLGLPRAKMISALGLAATQSGGLRATHGSMAIAYVPGVAARNGVASAYMASAGFTCSDHAIDGRNGLLQVLSATADPDQVTNGLGTEYEVLRNTYKPYPCGIVIHPAIDACLRIAREEGVGSDRIQRIDLRVHADAMNLTWRKLPSSDLDAQVSLYHWVAASLVCGEAGVAQGELRWVLDERVRALQEITHVEVDPALRDNQAVVSVKLQDGRTVSATTENAIGSVTNPMTGQQLTDKFKGLVTPALGAEKSHALLQFCETLSSASNAAEVFALTR
jgi:2-methylcitrate dehydratase PrpD